MGISWQDLSEIVAGYVISNKLPATAVNPNVICEPYTRLIDLHRKNKTPSNDLIIESIGLQPYMAATTAAENAKKVLPNQAIVMLEKACARAEAARRLGKEMKKLESGDDADLSVALGLLDQMRRAESRSVKMSEVKPDETSLIETGWEPLDKYIGGIPKIGITLVAGPPGVGKTSFAARLMKKWVAKHKKRVDYFTLEFTNGQLVKRALEVDEFTKKEKDLVYLCDRVTDVSDLVSVISNAKDTSLVIIDFAEMMVSGEAGPEIMASAHRDLLRCAKTLGIPIVILSQMNRKYDGAIPTLTMIKWAGEQTARLALLFYNPDSSYFAAGDAEVLPLCPGDAYWIVGKSTFGTKQKTVGAIRVPFDPQRGWGDKARKWHPLGSPQRVDNIQAGNYGSRKVSRRS